MIVKLIRNWHELEARASDKNNIYDNTTRKGTSETLEPAGWYWKYGSVKGNINPIADKGSVKDVTPYVNAASLKLKERENAFEILKKIFK